MKNVLIILLAALGMDIAGIFFSEGYALLICRTGSEYDIVMGMLYFVCFLVTVCTGLILSKLKAEPEQTKKKMFARQEEEDFSDPAQTEGAGSEDQ